MSAVEVETFKEAHGVRVENPPHAFEESFSAAGQEGRQVCVDSGAHLAAELSTLQLDTGRENNVLVTDILLTGLNEEVELVKG